MSGASGGDTTRWANAITAAALFAIDPAAFGGLVLRARPSPVRDRYLAFLRSCLPNGASLRRTPPSVPDDRLIGGLDLAATLDAGKAIIRRGLLAEADGGVLMLAMTERMEPGLCGRIAAAMDTRHVAVEREGFSERSPTRFAVVALDEGIDPDEIAPSALRDRSAFHADLDGIRFEDARPIDIGEASLRPARGLYRDIAVEDEAVTALCRVASALGIQSLRAPLFAVRAARAHAAYCGRNTITEEDIAVAARLVLAPRATALPAASDAAPSMPQPLSESPPSQSESESGADRNAASSDARGDVILESAWANLPPGLLARLQSSQTPSQRAADGRTGTMARGGRKGRPIGARPGDLRGGAKLHVLDTLRAAAPWQRLRARQQRRTAERRILVRRDDFRIQRFARPLRTTTIFVVDASGSAAAGRLAETKGAVELFLAECYVRRDNVALISFRDRGASVILPPTRSPARAKRCLAGLPAGGATPLAAAIDAAANLSDAVRRRGEVPLVVVLSDGRANIARDGNADRSRAESDALDAARRLRAGRIAALFVDTATRPRPFAAQMAGTMAASYLALPHANAAAVARAAQAHRPGTRAT